jgi:hypothetical protein
VINNRTDDDDDYDNAPSKKKPRASRSRKRTAPVAADDDDDNENSISHVNAPSSGPSIVAPESGLASACGVYSAADGLYSFMLNYVIILSLRI